MKLQLALLGVLLVAAPAAAKGLTIDDMLAMRRIGDPAVSPDGKQVAFAVRDTDVDANRGRFDVWLAATDGSSVPVILHGHEATARCTRAPRGRRAGSRQGTHDR